MVFNEATGNSDRNFDNNNTVYIGQRSSGSGSDFNGYIQDLRVYKGFAKYTSNFNVTAPSVEPTAAVSPSSIVAASAAATNFNPFNTDINTVRGQETGYNTFDPLLNRGNNTLSNGNTFVTGGSNWNTTLCTGVIESGKWFVELTHKGRQSASDNDIQFGLFGLNDPEDAYPLASTKDLAAQSTGYVIVDAQAKWYNNSNSKDYGVTWSTPGDVVGLRYDADTGKLGFIINGVDRGDISTTLSTSQRWVVGISLRGGGAKAEINFGQKPFKFPPPDGFQPLNTANTRPAKVISRPDQYVGVTTYTGNGSTISIDVGHEPDFLWIKNRDDTSQGAHRLFDTVRGSNKTLYSSFDLAEAEVANSLNSFNSNGFTVGSGNWVNGTDDKMVAWSWKSCCGSKGTFNKDGVSYATAADAGLQTQSGSGGGISVSACSIGTKQGFSIIKYGGGGNGENGIPHGLGRVPKFYIVKNITSGSSYWTIYHVGMGNTKGIYFDTAEANTNDWWDNTTPTEDLFYVKQASLYVHNGSDSYISYLWCDVPGHKNLAVTPEILMQMVLM